MITRKIHRSKNCLKNTLFKMIKKWKRLYTLMEALMWLRKHCKTYIITFRGSKTMSKYMVILIGHINVTEKKL